MVTYAGRIGRRPYDTKLGRFAGVFNDGAKVNSAALREPCFEELRLSSVVPGFSQVFDALLVTPRIVDYEATVPFAKINVGII